MLISSHLVFFQVQSYPYAVERAALLKGEDEDDGDGDEDDENDGGWGWKRGGHEDCSGNRGSLSSLASELSLTSGYVSLPSSANIRVSLSSSI